MKSIIPSGKILDVGCSGGEFLSYFLGNGWDCHGVDCSDQAVEEAKRRGIHAQKGMLCNVPLPLGEFDVVACLDNLYFSPSPLKDLERMHALLKRSGLLLLELPGHAFLVVKNVGPLSLLFNRRWCHLRPASAHLYYFSGHSIRRMLERAGFKVVLCEPEQSPIHGSALLRLLTHAYYIIARTVCAATWGRVNLASKVVLLCEKVP